MWESLVSFVYVMLIMISGLKRTEKCFKLLRDSDSYKWDLGFLNKIYHVSGEIRWILVNIQNRSIVALNRWVDIIKMRRYVLMMCVQSDSVGDIRFNVFVGDVLEVTSVLDRKWRRCQGECVRWENTVLHIEVWICFFYFYESCRTDAYMYG